jgi:hypothetical protein
MSFNMIDLPILSGMRDAAVIPRTIPGVLLRFRSRRSLSKSGLIAICGSLS